MKALLILMKLNKSYFDFYIGIINKFNFYEKYIYLLFYLIHLLSYK